MNIEKIKNYNQKLIAVLGTIIILFAIAGLIGFIGVMINEYKYMSYDDDIETGILSDEEVEKLQKENKREQVISYEEPRLIDTINSIYIIPISHKTLNEPEDIRGLLNIYSSEESEPIDNRYSDGIYGFYNNLIVYDSKSGTTTKIFDKRVNFNAIKVEHFKDEIIIVIKAATNDSHKDGVINLLDNKTLYTYSTKEKRLREISNGNIDLFDYHFINGSKDLILQYGIDKNKDGKFVEYNEPLIIKKYNYETETIEDIISPDINSELQMVLEGSKK
jgi:hypothetical protein